MVSQHPEGGPLSARRKLAAARDEAELIARITAGEKTLFHELIRPYEHMVYLAAYSVLRNPEGAERTAQASLLKAFTKLRQLRAGDRFKGWLLQITLDEARRRRPKDHKHLPEPLEGEE